MDVLKAIEAVPKGRGDKPVEDVVIADSGEVCLCLLPLRCLQRNVFEADFETSLRHLQLEMEVVVDEDGNEVPLREEL
jgi:hypothetical protein